MKRDETGKELALQNILATKLYVPISSSVLVERTRLFKLLDQGEGKKLILVSAPAGYGKTSLISEWICNSGHLFVWLSLDENDNDLKLFLTYFIYALRQIQGDIGKNILMELESPHPPKTKLLLTELINEISASPRFFFIVLDDYHTVLEPDIQEALTFLLEHQPPQMTLVISSRADPPWPLSRLRVVNEIVEVRAADLRFTLKETTAYLDDLLNMTLTSESILALYKRTEGWITGLKMAVISMRGKKDISGFINSFTGSHRIVVDYLMEEVLNLQTPEVREFLLKTCILDKLSGPLCTAITGETNSQDILQQLEKSNVFLTALDDSGNTFRYHRLFAELLQKRLQTVYPALATKIHRQASLWYGQNGYFIEAIRHAQKTKDKSFELDQLKAYVLPILQRGEIGIVRQWMGTISEDNIKQHPILCIAQAFVSLKNTSINTVEKLVEQAETGLNNLSHLDDPLDPNMVEQISSQIAILQSVISRAKGDPPEKQKRIVLQALDLTHPSGDTCTRASLFLRLGFCYLDIGKDEKADHYFLQAFKMGIDCGNLNLATTANYVRMVIAKRHGQLNTLIDICQDNPGLIKRSSHKNRSLAGIAYIMQGSIFYERNDLSQAENLLKRGLELSKKDGMTELQIKGHFALACTRIALGKVKPLPDLIQIAEHGNQELFFYAASLQARLNLLLAQNTIDSDHFIRARQWAESQTLTLRKQSSYDWEIHEKLTFARVHCIQFQSSGILQNRTRLIEILDFLTDQRATLIELDWLGILIELEVVRALLLATLDRVLESTNALEQALIMAEPQQYMRIFLDEGEILITLLRRSLKSEACGSYAQTLIMAFPQKEDSMLLEKRILSDGLIEPLSQRETQVLRFLETDLTVPQIALELTVSESTVRSHIKKIYSKLGVHSRYEAIQKGKALNIL